MSCQVVIPMALLFSAVAQGAGALELQPNRDEAFPIALCLVPEMDYIPEVDDWEHCPADKFPDHATAAQAAWEDNVRWAAQHATPRRTAPFCRRFLPSFLPSLCRR